MPEARVGPAPPVALRLAPRQQDFRKKRVLARCPDTPSRRRKAAAPHRPCGGGVPLTVAGAGVAPAAASVA